MGYTDAATDAFAIAEGAIVLTYVPASTPDTPATRTFKVHWGDVTGDGKVASADALYVALGAIKTYNSCEITDENGKTYSLNINDEIGDYRWGDVTGDGKVASADALYVALGAIKTYNSCEVNGQTIDINQPIDIVIDAE